MKRLPVLLLGALLVITIALPALASTRWVSYGPRASRQYGALSVNNNEWGACPGSQGAWAYSASNWGVWASQPYKAGAGGCGWVQSYPDVSENLGQPYENYGAIVSTYHVTDPSGWWGEAAYELWMGNGDEVMIWQDVHSVSPGHPQIGTADIQGVWYRVYAGTDGRGTQGYWFVRESNATSGTVHILTTLGWLTAHEKFGDPVVSQLQFGWEIFGTQGVKNLTVNYYNLGL